MKSIILKFKNQSSNEDYSRSKIHIIKALREATCKVDNLGNKTSNMGLKEAKDIVDILCVDGQVDFTEWGNKVIDLNKLTEYGLIITGNNTVNQNLMEILKNEAKNAIDNEDFETVERIIAAYKILKGN